MGALKPAFAADSKSSSLCATAIWINHSFFTQNRQGVKFAEQPKLSFSLINQTKHFNQTTIAKTKANFQSFLKCDKNAIFVTSKLWLRLL